MPFAYRMPTYSLDRIRRVSHPLPGNCLIMHHSPHYGAVSSPLFSSLITDEPKMAPPSMNSWEQPDHEEALQNFHSLINRSLFEGKAANPDFCKFCPEGVLRHYFEEFHHQNLRRLLKAVLYTQNAPHRELPTKDILGKEHSYVLIFAILLRIGQGRLIRHFSQHTSLCDTYLPFTAMPSAFPGALRQQEIFKDFRAMQWQFCPARMDSRQIAIWEEERILPIHTMEPIGKGGSADTFRIQIHDQYNKMDIGSNQRQVTPSCSFGYHRTANQVKGGA